MLLDTKRISEQHSAASTDLERCLQVVFLELCSERRGILTMTKQEVRQ